MSGLPEPKRLCRRGMTSRNHSSVHPPRSQAERPRSQALGSDYAKVLMSSSRSSFQPSAQGDCEEICQIGVEEHGLVQIFRVGARFSGRIVERMGPFSRKNTIPLFCKGFADPEEATRGLARLPPSAVRRRVHVFSNRKKTWRSASTWEISDLSEAKTENPV